MSKIALLFCNYGPYHLARLEGTFNYCQAKEHDVVGIELTRQDAEYPWYTQLAGLPFQVISVVERQHLEQVPFPQLVKQLYKVLSQVKPDILVVAGYSRPAMLCALLWVLWHRKLAILLSETTENDTRRFWWLETIKRWIIKAYKAALVGGKPQKRYLTKLGMPTDAIFLGYNVVGNDVFHPDKIRCLAKPQNKPYFLAINRFIPKKNLSFLLSSYANYRQKLGSQAWNLVLCGDGPLHSQIKQQIHDLGLTDVVYLPGFLQQEELLPYLAHASCFVHTSTQEQWGLVVNEAMAAGLPVLISNRCGCYEDLVIEGINGFGFDPENCQQLVDLMLKVSCDAVGSRAMGQAALEYIQKFSPALFAHNLIRAVEYTLAYK